MVVSRTNGVVSHGQFQVGFRNGSDNDYVDISLHPVGVIHYHIQDDGTSDEAWDSGSGHADDQVHSYAVIPPTTTGGTPRMFVDGVADGSPTFSGDDGVDNNFWWDSVAELFNVGMRGGTTGNELSNWVCYEVLIFDDVLTDQEVSDAHDILTNASFTSFSDKTVRRRGRRVFFAF